ncbi:HdeD family acid-resistance protein [Bianquea renquensis]|jgi:hypothetical protein|uniref:DUF308 domain-containing protein n=1 Tax=Bianquea renquensis TaxID=2763661 RepID=A0A926DTF3_9FIRM|nr:DUF308 domain-containing protein [Bianquea renquensis]MBC8543412.1 DUF308 domain-containing protein [Bianquea renquensis]
MKKTGSIIICICELLVGILLLINPVGFTTTIIIAVGIVLILTGIGSLISYFRTEPVYAARSQNLAKGLISIVAGLFCAFRSRWFIAVFPLLTMLYGVAILLTGIAKIQWAVDMLRLKMSKWFLAAIGAALSILFAAVILMNPFNSTTFLWTFVAVSLIVEAALDAIALLLSRSRAHSDLY